MLLWILGAAITLGVVLGARALLSRGQRALPAGSSWRPAIEEAARSLGGRAATGSDLELRAEHLDLTVTIKWRGDELIAEGMLRPGASGARIFLGTGGAPLLPELAHIPEVALPPAFSLDPPVELRSDDAAVALRFADDAARALAPLILEGRARSTALLVRGGTLRLTQAGARPLASVIEKVVRVTAELADALGGDRARAAIATQHIPAPAAGRVTCALCGGEQRPEVAWVRCARCSAPHHAECWTSAQACARPDCGGVTSQPM